MKQIDQLPNDKKLFCLSISCLTIGALLLSGCSFDNLHEASAECETRAVEHRLDGLERARHKNLCMASRGYKRNTKCSTEALVNSGAEMCYSPKWQFWIEEQKLL